MSAFIRSFPEPLPSFIQLNESGIFLHLDQLQLVSDLRNWIERVFKLGFYFQDLDYDTLHSILYDYTPPFTDIGPEVFLATNLLDFPIERQQLYTKPIADRKGHFAEYSFKLNALWREPLSDENELIENEVPPIPAFRVDEWIAALWLQGFQFGLDLDAVRSMMSPFTVGTKVIARYREPSDGLDASVIETSTRLHEKHTPKTRDGKIHLHEFENRFPQVKQGDVLLKKIPRTLGAPGYTLQGQPIEAPLPQDLDLSRMGSMGTQVKSDHEGDFIIAAIDGFLFYDIEKQLIMVSEHLENKNGVSSRTTGNLNLEDIDHYIEHGDVDDRRTVKGNTLTFHANVYGEVIAEQQLMIHGNLVSGKAETQQGDLTIQGRASQAIIRSTQGAIHLEKAEQCIIIGPSVHIKYAMGCTIITPRLEAETLEGCVVASQNITIQHASDRKGFDTRILIFTPNISGLRHQIALLIDQYHQHTELFQKQKTTLTTLERLEDYAKYLRLKHQIDTKQFIPSAQQKQGWFSMQEKFKKQDLLYKQITQKIQELEPLLQQNKAEQDELTRLLQEQLEETTCTIANILGGVVIHQDSLPEGYQRLVAMKPESLKEYILQQQKPQDLILHLEQGSVTWKHSSTAF